MDDELAGLPAAELARMMRVREVSPVEVVGAYLRRIEELNPRLNAVVTLAPDAAERAREAEARLARGDCGGPLLGVPVTIKDTIETAALRTTFGSAVRSDYVPAGDAPAVARLRRAGAIILGKTNTSEMALDYTADNPVFGRTNNPHDLARTPGGSSGGCAAAVSACLSAGSLGSDLVGSVRVPAHFCGVSGLRPTAGRVPCAGHFPPVEGVLALGASLGPLARTAEDLALFFEVLSGGAGARAPGAESTGVSLRSLRGQRVAWYTDDGVVPVSEECREGVGRAAAALRDAGMDVFEGRPPGVERGTELWLSLFSHATQRIVGAAYEGREELAGPAARAVLGRAAGAAAPGLADFMSAWAERDRLRAGLLGWMESAPLVLAPVGAVPAFEHGARSFTFGGRKVGLFRAFGYAQALNVFDLPVACVPAGRTAAGLPVGVQIIGRPFEERRVLLAARAVDDALGRRRAAPEAPSNTVRNPI